MSDESQERPLKPSEHKLRKAREKGEVASSADFVSGTTVIIALIVVIFSWPQFVKLFSDLLTTSLQGFRADFKALGLNYFLGATFSTMMSVVPLLFVVTMVAILANIIHKRGIPFSMHPVKPDFKKINPASGLKKLFGRRNLTEFAISFVRSVIWFTVAILLAWILWPALVAAPQCGLACVIDMGVRTGFWIIVLAIIILIVMGLLDLPVQFALFEHEQKMSHQEYKRELRDTQGSAEFKGHRRETHRESAANTLGMRSATFMIEGGGCVIALRFNSNDTPIPIVVAKGRGPHGDRINRAGRKTGLSVVQAPNLAGDIYRQVPVGGAIKAEHFGPTATIIIELGIPIG